MFEDFGDDRLQRRVAFRREHLEPTVKRPGDFEPNPSRIGSGFVFRDFQLVPPSGDVLDGAGQVNTGNLLPNGIGVNKKNLPKGRFLPRERLSPYPKGCPVGIYADMDPIHKILLMLERRGMSAADLTRLTGISSGRISKLSQGQGELRLPEALRAARAVGVTLEWIVDPDMVEPVPIPSELETACHAAIRQLGPAEALRRLLCVPRASHVIEPGPGPEKRNPSAPVASRPGAEGGGLTPVWVPWYPRSQAWTWRNVNTPRPSWAGMRTSLGRIGPGSSSAAS